MRCPSCGHDNRPGLKFCTNCGAGLGLSCPSCGEPVQPDARFCGECGASLTEPVAESSASLSTTDRPVSFAEGRYKVQKLLGEGGKKKVYLAHDTTLDREVALAVIKPEGLDEASRLRISREAQDMARLGDHSNILQIHDLGEEAGEPYMVLPVMQGDVEGLIEDAPDHRLSLEQSIKICKQVCRGLEHAHAQSIVHRDLKPGNVSLTGEGTAKIADFGLAVAADRSRLTQEGMMVGTFSYMPPEQAIGGDVTAQADLYSLGAMLYEMVTGRPPFVGDDNVAIIGQHLNTPPVAPTWHNKNVPPALEVLIMRLLEKDPSSRPGSAHEVHEALDAIDVGARHAVPLQDATDAATGPAPVYRHTFVGREAEVRQLHTAFDGTMSGEGSLMMVVGEPGIGKTSLTEQLATYVKLRGGSALVGHCYEEGSLSLPYLAFVEAMRSYVLGREPEDLKEELGSGASDVARIVSEIRDRVEVEPSEPSDPEQDRYRLLQAVTSFLRNAAAVQPILIVLEDLHDADRGTLDLLKHVARNLSGSRLMIVGTYRDVEVDRTHALSGTLADLRRVSNFGRIPLRGLTADEVQRMMAGIAGQELPWGTSEAVHRQTEGNPLFVQEVLRYLVEEGFLAREAGDETRQTPPEMRIPEGLRDVIGKRLTRLTDECNQVAAMAAVVGRDFRLDVLQRVAGLPEDDLYAALEEAKNVGIIEERSGVGEALSFRFAHAFFRQTLYEEMFAPRRIRLHQQVGQALEEVYSERPEEHAAELAEHFTQSTDREDLTKALTYSEMAVERAMGVYAYGEAAGHLDRCLQVQEVIDPDDRAKRCDLLLALGGALMPAGEPLRVMELVAPEAFALAEAIADRGRASRACRIALEAAYQYGAEMMWSSPEYRLWAERADRYAEPDTTDRVLADLALGGVRFSEDGPIEARALRLRALELARRLDDPETLYLAASPFVEFATPRDQEERRQLVTDMSAYPRTGVTAKTLSYWLLVAGIAWLDWGERARAESSWEELGRLAQRTDDAIVLVRSFAVKPWLDYLDGRLEEARSGVEHLLRRANELGAPVRGQWFAGVLGFRPLLHVGRGDEAVAAFREGDRLAEVEDTSPFIELFAVLVRAYAGPSDEAADGLRRLTTEHPEILDENTMTFSLVMLLESALLIEDRDLSSVLAERLAPAAFLSTTLIAQTCPARHLGGAYALLGEPAKAREYYQQALEACAKIRFRPETALTRLQLAELLLENYPDERPEALEHLDFAIGEFRDMKMQPSLERALGHRDILKA